MAESYKEDILRSRLTSGGRGRAYGIYDSHISNLELAKSLDPTMYLLVGCCSDEGTLSNTDMTERVEYLRNCKWVDEVIPDAQRVPDLEFTKKHRIDVVLDSSDGPEEQSQTAVDEAENNKNSVVCNSSDLSDRLRHGPPICIRVYVHGVYDGDDDLLELAKKMHLNTYLLVGCCKDEDMHKFKNRVKTVMTYSERLDSLRSCRWIDEVIPDAPFAIDEEFLSKHCIDYYYTKDTEHQGELYVSDVQ